MKTESSSLTPRAAYIHIHACTVEAIVPRRPASFSGISQIEPTLFSVTIDHMQAADGGALQGTPPQNVNTLAPAGIELI